MAIRRLMSINTKINKQTNITKLTLSSKYINRNIMVNHARPRGRTEPKDGDKKVNEHDCSDESVERNLKMAISRLMSMMVVMRA